MKLWTFILALVFVGFSAFAEEYSQLRRSGNHLRGLKLNTATFRVVRVDGKTRSVLWCEFWGFFLDPSATFWMKQGGEAPTQVELDDQGRFSIWIPIDGLHNPMELETQDASGTRVAEKVEFYFERFEEYKAPPPVIVPKPQTRFSMSLGLTPTFYTQPQVSSFKQMGVSAKVGIDQSFGESPWSIGANAFTTAFSLFTTADDLVKNENLRFFGANLRVGYRLPWLKAPWSLTVALGPYYTTSYSSNLLGYSNFFGIQLYPVLNYKLPYGDMVNLYLKFSPVSAQFNLLSPASREIATGYGYQFAPDASGFAWTLRVDLAYLVLHYFEGNDINLVTSTFSVGVSF